MKGSLALVCVGESCEEKAVRAFSKGGHLLWKEKQRLVLKCHNYDIIKEYYRTKYAKVEIHGEIY